MNITTKSKKLTADQQTHASRVNDEMLLRSYRRTGDGEAFAQLVHRYENEIYNYLRRYTGHAEMAEDAFQTTFLQVHLKCNQFDDGRKLRPWLYAIATNQAIDLQRRNRRHQAMSLNRAAGSEALDQAGQLIDLLETDETGPLTKLHVAERRSWVQNELKKLPEHLCTVVRLIYYQGLKYREAADALAIPVGTVKSRLHSAILKLTEAWQSAILKTEE